jgi:DNA-binding YbaB/EbfC family protein
MQADMARAQEEIAAAEVEASSGGGMVTVTMSGALEVRSVRIDPGAIDPDDPDLLSDLVLAAFNEALRSAQQLASARMEQVTGGLDLGSLGGLGLPGL